MGKQNQTSASAYLLDMDYINSLPQPLMARKGSRDWWWPVNDIEVKTGLLRVDICGKLEIWSIGEVVGFMDDRGVEHSADDFYADPDCWVHREQPNCTEN